MPAQNQTGWVIFCNKICNKKTKERREATPARSEAKAGSSTTCLSTTGGASLVRAVTQRARKSAKTVVSRVSARDGAAGRFQARHIGLCEPCGCAGARGLGAEPVRAGEGTEADEVVGLAACYCASVADRGGWRGGGRRGGLGLRCGRPRARGGEYEGYSCREGSRGVRRGSNAGR